MDLYLNFSFCENEKEDYLRDDKPLTERIDQKPKTMMNRKTKPKSISRKSAAESEISSSMAHQQENINWNANKASSADKMLGTVRYFWNNDITVYVTEFLVS